MSEQRLSKSYQRQATFRVTLIGLVMNLLLAFGKIVIGTAFASHALLADGFHSLSDLVSDLALLWGARVWLSPADESHPHGHKRVETFFAFSLGVLLALSGLAILFHSAQELLIPKSRTLSLPVFVMAVISLLAKEILYRITERKGTEIRSTALIANAWHHRSDALSSIPVIIAVFATTINPEWFFLDAVGAIVVSLFIVKVGYSLAKPALKELVDGGASKKERDTILSLVRNTPGVRAVHALRTRYLGRALQVDFHIQVDPNLSVHEGHSIAGAAKHRVLRMGPNVIDVLVHLEPYGQTLDEHRKSEEDSL